MAPFIHSKIMFWKGIYYFYLSSELWHRTHSHLSDMQDVATTSSPNFTLEADVAILPMHNGNVIPCTMHIAHRLKADRTMWEDWREYYKTNLWLVLLFGHSFPHVSQRRAEAEAKRKFIRHSSCFGCVMVSQPFTIYIFLECLTFD